MLKILVIANLISGLFTPKQHYEFTFSDPMPEQACQNLADRYNGSRMVGNPDYAFCDDPPNIWIPTKESDNERE